MDDYQCFMNEQRLRLLTLLDASYHPQGGYQSVLAELNRLCEDWCDRFAGMTLPTCSGEERTFWFALIQLEELLVSYGYALRSDWEDIQLNVLNEVRELLRAGLPLREGYFASRPNGS
ncbi:hypothetical protein CWE12_10850 [Aliidiomarina sedimenti]|uniref:Flagellar protein FlaF n=1 Tax=Aliidiomarina sedimenti TaxID=1933879 RepID=A0ABY0BWM8_9GAMM|nr:hypothetical protein [Aliidiomarina sedimenti]RUO28803.1 hypothetical protein CWE12_10850 [Aliidiomarina sedimenti]